MNKRHLPAIWREVVIKALSWFAFLKIDAFGTLLNSTLETCFLQTKPPPVSTKLKKTPRITPKINKTNTKSKQILIESVSLFQKNNMQLSIGVSLNRMLLGWRKNQIYNSNFYQNSERTISFKIYSGKKKFFSF